MLLEVQTNLETNLIEEVIKQLLIHHDALRLSFNQLKTNNLILEQNNKLDWI